MRFAVLALALCLGSTLSAQTPKPIPHAIRNARVVVSADKVLEKATVILRDGVIADIVPGEARIPGDAIVIEGAGLTVYPGFFDAASTRSFDASLKRSEGGPPSPEDLASDVLAATKPDYRRGMTPEFEVRNALNLNDDTIAPWRKLGFTLQLSYPDGGYFNGQSALLSLNGTVPRQAVLKSNFAQHASLRNAPGSDYPRALMGVFAHCRQAMLDAGYFRRQLMAFEKGALAGKRPPFDPCLEALILPLTGKMPVVFEADSADEIHRALDFAEEFQLKPIILGGRDAWKVKDRLKSTQTPVILRLNFSEISGSRPRAKSKDAEPGDPAADAQVQKDREAQLPKRVQDDRQRQRREEMACAGELDRAGVRIAFSTQGLEPEKFLTNLRKAIDNGLRPERALKALSENAAEIFGVSSQFGTLAKGRSASLLITTGDFHLPESQVKFVFAEGIKFEAEPKSDDKKKDPAKKDDSKKEEAKKGDVKKDKPMPAIEDDKGRYESELESDRTPKLQTQGNVVIRNATVLTAAKPPRIEKADLMIENGRIAWLKIADPAKTYPGKVIDATGMFVIPGIIDTHAHFAISGGVNEYSLSVVPEVRVRDVINSEDVQIYRCLAGGVTTARLLHGSSNVIGGQDAVIQMKYGRPARDLLLADAPRGVKFALGENVKRTDGRFPNSRPGVEAVLVRAFSEAQAYRKTWEDYEKSGKTLPEPRRDLRLEALSDVLAGTLKVHCHCYRSDEILMLLRVADRFGVKIQSLQHVLEGYKVAPEIAAHGSSCSLFSDWWAYKIEAYDAIPHAGALMNEAGVNICLKSDSNELVRHLYQEAAKLIKYGGMSEEDALKSITLNGARQLGLEAKLGSIEPGKQADLAIFNGHPLNGFARCEMTLIAGEVYFQRSEKLEASKIAMESPTRPSPEVGFVKGKPGQPTLLKNVTLHNPGKAPIVADVRVFNGKIEAIGRELDSEGNTVLNCRGFRLYPGMINAGTVIGLSELGSARETMDFSDGGDFQPDLRAAVAVNPESELIPVTRANGVLTVITRPMGGVVSGQSALINLAGWVPREMAIIEQYALHLEFPQEVAFSFGDPTMPMLGRTIARKQREEKIRKLKDLFEETKRYDAARKENSGLPVIPRLEAMLPYVRGEKPVVVTAYRDREILDTLKLAEELKLKLILSGATDAWKVTEEIKKANVPVVIGPVMALPQENHDPYDCAYANAARLHQAGIRFCIQGTGGSNARNLPYEAAMAVAYGLPADEALKSITLYPAQILGVADQLGSIEVGKRANLVLTNGDLLQPSTQVLGLVIDGKLYDPSSKQTRLYEKYRERLKEFREGRAPLGTGK